MISKHHFLVIITFYVLLFTGCTGGNTISQERPQIVLDSLSKFERIFAESWLSIDSNYVYFTDDSNQWWDVYQQYLTPARACYDATSLCAFFADFSSSECNGNILINYKKAELIPTMPTYKDKSSTLNTSFKCSEYKHHNYFFAVSGFLCQQICRTNDEDPIYNVLIAKNTSYPISYSVELLQLLAMLHSSNGTIIDLRDNFILNSNTALYILSLCLGDGETINLHLKKRASWKNHTKMTPAVEFPIKGEGLLANVPIAIIVNEGTRNVANIFAHALASRDNVEIIGRAPSGGGNGFFDSDSVGVDAYLYYPKALIDGPNHESYADSLRPERIVAWEGWEKADDSYRYADPCVLAAMNFIDTYNSK